MTSRYSPGYTVIRLLHLYPQIPYWSAKSLEWGTVLGSRLQREQRQINGKRILFHLDLVEFHVIMGGRTHTGKGYNEFTHCSNLTSMTVFCFFVLVFCRIFKFFKTCLPPGINYSITLITACRQLMRSSHLVSNQCCFVYLYGALITISELQKICQGIGVQFTFNIANIAS